MKNSVYLAVLLFAVMIGCSGCGRTSGATTICTELDAPVLKINLDGEYPKLTWNKVPGANGYNLYYAPYPGRELWEVIDVGNTSSYEVLWPEFSYYVLVRAYNECEESDNVFAEYFIVDTDLHYGLAHGNGQAVIEVRAWGMWCNNQGDISPLPEGSVFYLHSHIKNKTVGVCDNVLASAVVTNGWLKFIFDNPANFIDPLYQSDSYILDKHWITDQFCTGGPSECHLWIPQPEKNDLYVLNCDGNPEIAVVYYQDEMTPVPPDTPCTVVGVDCLD